MIYQVEILNNSRTLVAPITNLVPINSSKDTIYITWKLSGYGQCKFRIGTKDPLFDAVGDVLEPYRYIVRIRKSGTVIWEGPIIKNTDRNKRYVEVVAFSYLFLLTKNVIRQDTTGDTNFRTFKSGTMDTAVTTLINEAKTDLGSPNPLASMTIGTVENPDFPSGYVRVDNTALTGAWTFSSDMTLSYDYRDTYYVINSMAMYPACDFEIDNNLVFNFQQFLGRRQPNLTFTYGEFGNVLDYNIPRNGERMANSLVGVAADTGYNIIHTEQVDNVSVSRYGKVQDVAAYVDVKNKNALQSRLVEELRLISVPDSEIHLVLNDKAYPYGQYKVGDIVTIDINDNVVSFRNQQRRIVGINMSVSNNGSESIKLITNKPKEGI
jgi:hypothetical protein